MNADNWNEYRIWIAITDILNSSIQIDLHVIWISKKRRNKTLEKQFMLKFYKNLRLIVDSMIFNFF